MIGFKWYPAAWLAGFNAVMAAVVAFGFLTQETAAIVATAVVAGTGLVAVFTVRPVALAAVSQALSAFLVAISGFGLHLADVQITAVVVLATMIANGILHLGGVPVAGSPALLDPKLAALAPRTTAVP